MIYEVGGKEMEENGFEIKNDEQLRLYVKKEKNIQKYISVFIIAALSIFILGFGVIRIAKLQSANEKLADMCEEYEEKIKEQNIEMKDYFSDIEGLTAFESGKGKHKNLNIICYFSLTADNVSEVTSSIADRIEEAQKEDWFDYDYIMVDFCNEYAGRITSMTIDANDLNRITQTNEWYGNKDLSISESEGNIVRDVDSDIDKFDILVYEDENVKIYFGKISEKGVEFLVENLTDLNLTIQADSISINGMSTNDIMMSDDIAPQSQGKVVARCEDFDTNTIVETVGGQLRIVDFKHDLKSYDATFVNIEVKH